MSFLYVDNKKMSGSESKMFIMSKVYLLAQKYLHPEYLDDFKKDLVKENYFNKKL